MPPTPPQHRDEPTEAHGSMSPALASAARATEDAWRRLEHRFGLYTGAEIAQLLGYGEDHEWASSQRRAGKLLGVRLRGQYRYPGFQVRPDGALSEVMADLVRLAREHGWSDESLALWLASPSGSMPDDCSPAAMLHDDPRLVLAAARISMQPTW